jgi:beta-lactamase regulating signal transducer with metallopeptidase domain
MEIYILKSAACLGVFFIFYKVFLENENMHLFKRFYLLGTIFIPFLIPFITFTTFINPSETISQVVFTNTIGEDSNSLSFLELLPTILWSIYFIGVAFFTFRFVKNLISLVLKIKRNPKLNIQSHINVLLQKQVIPHTFFKYIFLNKSNYEAKEIPEEVLLHEQTHANQKHSIDIIFIEILQILFWFNPLIYLLKNSIKLNHEFLADEAVLSRGIESRNYQKILLVFSSNTPSPHLANSINYSLIKKRFTVMKKQTSRSKIWVRSFLILPLLAIVIFSFSSTKEIERENLAIIENTIQEGATKAQIAEYNKLAKYYNDLDQSNMRIKKSDVERLKYLYNLMTERQRKSAEAFPNFPPPPPPPPSPDKAPKPMKVVKGINDKDPKAPPPPPKAPKAPKVVKGVNDSEANITPTPPKEPKTIKDPIKYIEGLAENGARFLFFDGGPHHKNGMDITKEKAIEFLKKYNDLTVNVRDDNYLYKIVEIRMKGC